VPLPGTRGSHFFSSPCKQQSITKKVCTQFKYSFTRNISQQQAPYISHTLIYIVVLRPTQSFLETQQQKHRLDLTTGYILDYLAPVC
jgi:hypothetical protein